MKFLNVDLLVALAAFLWAVLATYQQPLAALVSAEAAFTFALAAAGRGVLNVRKAIESDALPSQEG